MSIQAAKSENKKNRYTLREIQYILREILMYTKGNSIKFSSRLVGLLQCHGVLKEHIGVTVWSP